MIERICQHCGKRFSVSPVRVRRGGAKYCSIQCYSQTLRGIIKPAWRRKVERVCLQCGRHFWVKPSQVKHSGAKFCSLACIRKYYGNPILRFCRECGAGFFVYPSRVRNGQGKFCSNKCRLGWLHEENAKHLLPTKPELQLKAILNKHFPQFKYNGDFSLGIKEAGLTPDFVNISKNQIIEVYGNYWHSPEVTGDDWRRNELGRIMAFNSVGYRCLVIWERELMNEQAVIDKIKRFLKRRSTDAKRKITS